MVDKKLCLVFSWSHCLLVVQVILPKDSMSQGDLAMLRLHNRIACIAHDCTMWTCTLEVKQKNCHFLMTKSDTWFKWFETEWFSWPKTCGEQGEVAVNNRVDVRTYTSLHKLVNDMFPAQTYVEQVSLPASLKEITLWICCALCIHCLCQICQEFCQTSQTLIPSSLFTVT